MDKGKVQQVYEHVLEKVKVCNNIRYVAYRTASKLCILQSELNFSDVQLKMIKGVFEHHRIFKTDNPLKLQPDEIEDILYDIYFATSKQSPKHIDVDLSTNLMMMFLQNVYNQSQSGPIAVFDLKVALVCLCCSPLQTKYQYWFSELADHNLCLPRRRLQTLLESLVTIAHHISESNTFSYHLIQPTMDSCYIQGCSLGMNEVNFISWVLKEPQLLVWLSTFYRLRAAEKVLHEVHCAVCHVYPIRGLRYHCLRCICYDLCQNCFFTAKTSKRHKTRHMIREYCSQTNSYETTVAFIKGLINRFCGNSTSRLQYLPAQNNSQGCRSNSCEEDPVVCEKKSTLHGQKSGFDGLVKPVHQFEAIISQIETETRLLKEALGKDSNSSLINQHTLFLQEQLDRLRYLQNDVNPGKPSCVMSTPVANFKAYNDFELSPILVQPEETWHQTSPSGFSSWLHSVEPETTQTKQLQADLDKILNQLQVMLETNFSVCDQS